MKKISLIAPSFFGYDKAIAAEIQNQGVDVIHLDDRPRNTNFLKICIRFRMSFMIQRALHQHRKYLVDKILSSQSDVLFLLNPEVFTKEMLLKLKEENPSLKVILYLWDSLKNRKKAHSLIEFADAAYSFDRLDVLNNPTLNFYPLFFESSYFSKGTGQRVYDLSFIGSYHSNRANLIRLKDLDIKYFLHLYIQGPIVKIARSLNLITDIKLLKLFWKNTTYKTLNKEQVGKIFRESNCVIDLQHPDQSGLTCRTFEALASGCKIVTTNLDIVNYDFYRSDIICAIPDMNSLPVQFIKTRLSEDVIEEFSLKMTNYSITEWVKSVVIKHL